MKDMHIFKPVQMSESRDGAIERISPNFGLNLFVTKILEMSLLSHPY